MRNISRPVAFCSQVRSICEFVQCPVWPRRRCLEHGEWGERRRPGQRTDVRISAASMPGFSFLWKVKVNNDAKQTYSLSQAVMVDAYIGYRGFRSYAFLAGSSNNVIAFDSDIGRLEWTKNFGQTPAGNATCPGAMTAGVTRTASFAPAAAPAAGAGRGGRGPTPAQSGMENRKKARSRSETLAPRQGPPADLVAGGAHRERQAGAGRPADLAAAVAAETRMQSMRFQPMACSGRFISRTVLKHSSATLPACKRQCKRPDSCR